MPPRRSGMHNENKLNKIQVEIQFRIFFPYSYASPEDRDA